MTILKMPGYGIGSGDEYIIAERITNFKMIDYNGRWGTRIVLDTGKEISVDLPSYKVEEMINAVFSSDR
jgi:hypothetical protein